MFCPKCGSILLPKKEGSQTVMKCSCGYKSTNLDTAMIREEVIDESKSVEIVDKKDDYKSLPKMKAECPKCGNNEAYFWEVQTRASDEPATKFLRCTKCNGVWRDYN